MSYHVEESIVVNCDRKQAYDTIVDFNTWTKWSPWLCCDKAAKVTVTEDSRSEGSMYHWAGPVVGEGEIVHKKLLRNELIDQEIRFIKPFKSISRVWFDLHEAPGGTKVTWNMKGSLPWFLFWMKASLERYISMDYRRGLQMLAEFLDNNTVASETTVGDVVTVGPFHVVGIRESCEMSKIGASMDDAFRRLESKLKSAQISKLGEMISVYHKLDMKTQVMQYTAGYAVPEYSELSDAALCRVDIPQTSALYVKHTGSYDHLGNGWAAAYANARHKKLKVLKGCASFEIYRNSPTDTAPEALVTDIYLPVRVSRR